MSLNNEYMLAGLSICGIALMIKNKLKKRKIKRLAAKAIKS